MQNLIVALIVIAAMVFTVRKYLPVGLRVKIVHALRRRGAAPAKVAAWLDTTSSCGGGCDSCGSCEEPVDGQAQEHVIKVVRR